MHGVDLELNVLFNNSNYARCSAKNLQGMELNFRVGNRSAPDDQNGRFSQDPSNLTSSALVLNGTTKKAESSLSSWSDDIQNYNLREEEEEIMTGTTAELRVRVTKLLSVPFIQNPSDMEPSAKMPELLWGCAATSSVQHEYPISGTVSVDEVEMMSQLLTSYSISHDQTVSSWPYSQEALNMVEGEDSLDSSVYFGTPSSLHYWQQNAPAQDHDMYPNSSKEFVCYMLNDERAGRFLHAGQQEPWADAMYGTDTANGDDSGEFDAVKPVESIHPSDQNLVTKRKPQLLDDDASALAACSYDNPKKKARNLGDLIFEINLMEFAEQSQRGAKNPQIKKTQKIKNDGEEDNAALSMQSPSSNTSEDDSIVSQEQNGATSSSAALNLSGKMRAGRGSATDPQSLYARKRRERINERLRILQNLVPNGTKLLSSDDLWMYAPIAYNGMDIGLDLKISQP
ncbi:Transcription factor [Nymphaea thermarum]|nr:Transcription factor [Nymphaea thermarum]